jgi:release factor glutamine methyltransferase
VPSIADLLADGRRRLAAAPFRPEPREAALLLGRVLGWSEARLLAHPDSAVDGAAARRFADLLERRLRGEPVAYLFGEREFYGRAFLVDPRVLIPRPESEHLIERALALALPACPRILDLGTGSGCLAVTLALELARARVVATDRSPAALAVARTNARRLAAQVAFAGADLATALNLDRFDLVVANPPYVGRQEEAALSPEVVEHEPASALFAAEGGLAIIRRLLTELGGLPPAAALLIEIGRGQAAPVEDLAAGSAFELLEIHPDLAGIPRVAALRRGGAASQDHPRL